MIEFNCQHCNTNISIATDQIADELFCPACEKEVEFPKLTPNMEAKLALAKAQAKGVVKENLDHTKAVEMLQEPDSKETTVWKERLAVICFFCPTIIKLGFVILKFYPKVV